MAKSKNKGKNKGQAAKKEAKVVAASIKVADTTKEVPPLDPLEPGTGGDEGRDAECLQCGAIMVVKDGETKCPDCGVAVVEPGQSPDPYDALKIRFDRLVTLVTSHIDGYLPPDSSFPDGHLMPELMAASRLMIQADATGSPPSSNDSYARMEGALVKAAKNFVARLREITDDHTLPVPKFITTKG